ncbi:MAG: cell wall-binding repeat-containing protein [Canibacter sp.]
MRITKFFTLLTIVAPLTIVGAVPFNLEASPEGGTSLNAPSVEDPTEVDGTEQVPEDAAENGEFGDEQTDSVDEEAEEYNDETAELSDASDPEDGPSKDHPATPQALTRMSVDSLTGTTQAEAPAGGLWGGKRNERLGGSDRYETAVKVSKSTYTSTAKTVIVATGMDYPDSLSAAPLAAKLKAPLLLTETNRVPTVTSTEIDRLKPTAIIIVGGKGVVTSKVESDLKKQAASVSRLSGDDRYATSAAISKYGWKTSSEAFVSTGMDYADALAAGPAAARRDAPVMLVPGLLSTAPAAVKSQLKSMNVSHIRIAGGTGVVTPAIQKSLTSGTSISVTRYSGSDRYDTSVKIANDNFSSSTSQVTYMANGMAFADALTGAAAAGAQNSPLLLSASNCIPANVYKANDRILPKGTYLLGGTGVLKNTVLHGNECMTVKPKGITSTNWKGTNQAYAQLNKKRYDAGVSGARLADTAQGTPAYTWSNSMYSKGYRQDPNAKKNNAWVNDGAIARSGSANQLVDRMFGNASAKVSVSSQVRGKRQFVSVGYVSGNGNFLTVYTGVDAVK